MSDQSSTGDNEVDNMKAIETAIVNQEHERLKSLLANRQLDSLQKSYLIDLAKLNGSASVVDILQDAPVKFQRKYLQYHYLATLVSFAEAEDPTIKTMTLSELQVAKQ